MKQDIHISIVIPVYNARHTIADTVASVACQDHDAFEIILVDDGSTDGSSEVCDRLASSDRRIKVVHKENGGVSSARNAGIAASSGEYVMFMDADDLLRAGALRAMSGSDADFVLAGFEKIENGKAVTYVPDRTGNYDGISAMSSFFDNTIHKDECYLLNSPCFKLFRLSVIRSCHVSFVEGLSYAEDKIFVFSFLAHASSACTISSVVYSYLIREVSLSSDKVSDAHLKQVLMLLKEYHPLLSVLTSRYADSRMLRGLYHTDFISRYVCRILTAFATRRSDIMNEECISLLYSYMDADSELGILSVRPGQIINLILYRLHAPAFTCSFYRLTSSLFAFCRNLFN